MARGTIEADGDSKTYGREANAVILFPFCFFVYDISRDINVDDGANFQLAGVKDAGAFNSYFPADIFGGAAAVQHIIEHGSYLSWFRGSFTAGFIVALASAVTIAVTLADSFAFARTLSARVTKETHK